MLTTTQYSVPSRPNRMRLSGYDYSSAGLYFVTICSSQKLCTFGTISEFQCSVLPLGALIEQCWLSIPDWFPEVTLDQFIVMPNHFHGILQLLPLEWRKGKDTCGMGLPTVISSFKSGVTRRAKESQLLSEGSVWQRGYHDRIIRSEAALMQIRRYIVDNPAKWQMDKYYRSGF